MISREEAIKMLKLLEYAEESPMYDALNMAIEALSHERPKGRWEEIRNTYGEIEGWICTCGREVKCKDNYCPNCGTEMER